MADACPLCGRSKRLRRRLYGQLVCNKCLYGFANRRQLAYIFDSLLIGGVFFVVSFMMALSIALLGGSQQLINFSAYGLMLINFVVWLGKDGIGGLSPGKALTGVQVFDQETGAPIGVGQSMRRNLALLIPFAVLVALVQMNGGPRLGDRFAKTKVIWRKYAGHPIFEVGHTSEIATPETYPEYKPDFSGTDPANPYQAPRS